MIHEQVCKECRNTNGEHKLGCSFTRPAEEPKCERCGGVRFATEGKDYSDPRIGSKPTEPVRWCLCSSRLPDRPPTTEGKLNIKLDTPEAKQRWENIKKASAEVDNWPPELRVEAGRTCPCPTECGHPVERHQLISTARTVCRDCPPASIEDMVRDEALTFLRQRIIRDVEKLTTQYVQDEIDRQRPAIEQAAVGKFMGLVNEQIKHSCSSRTASVVSYLMHRIAKKMEGR